ncbi:PQQ-binding-like beta-propeller repeat protein [Streptomyces peucetius]|uniref:PQQ-binding-like beta-propeller repeat protein n=1 Tax=Streptomyces peucetius TaxID=1950 RepID=A0ABY6I6F1_STRPE|nr:PQQ-binding-like beta-propeller repeat protein [Streptomyces peucetius]UYQ62578.1 PQQ-binding-like beta-propeller repeat protein [Streptomyces peucetius]
MTQPPPPNQPPGPPPGQPPNQPPNQPPGSGYGLSKDQPQQPAGGYGTPPPPQNQPPGYPQTPPQAPQAQPPAGPGYGYPQTAPQSPPPGAPYGYPQQGAPGQPAYSAPTQPMQAQPARAEGGGGFLNKTQLQIVVAACLAIVLIIGGGFWYSATKDDGGKQDQAKNSSDGTGGKEGESKGGEEQAAPDGPGTEKAPADPASKVAFQLPLPPRIDVTGVPGSWVTDRAYVKTGVNTIDAYDAAKGSKLWSLPLPGQVCAASRRTTEDDKTAVVFEAKKRAKSDKGYPPCSEVGVVDLATGKLLWSKSVTGGSSGDGKARFDQVTISGNTVAAGYVGGSAAFDLTTGAVRWKPTVDAEQCKDIGYGGGKALIAVRRCGSYDDPQVTIQALNPEDGTPLSSFKMPEGVEDARVVSSDPLVVAADVGDTGMFGISDFFSIDVKTGKLRARIAAPGDKYLARCSASDGVEGCQFVVVGNDRLYLPTEEHEGTGESYSRTNEIVAFDLATGKAVPGRADAGDGYHSLPLRMDGGNIIAYKWPPYDKGGQVVSINGATLKETVLLVNPSDKTVRDAETSFVETGSEYHFRNGRLFIADDTLSEPDKDSTSSSKYLAISFGPKG